MISKSTDGPFVAAYCEHCHVLFAARSMVRAKHFCVIGEMVELKPFAVRGIVDLDEICIYEMNQ